MKVVFCCPVVNRPTAPFMKALEECLPAIEQAGWEHQFTSTTDIPYISGARAEMTRMALDAKADVIVYLDYDLSWRPESMVKLLSIDEHVVAGTYRFKNDEGQYMGGILPDGSGAIQVGSHGCIKADRVPAGFLKVTKKALSIFAKAYPHLLYSDPMSPSLDLFNHGAIDGVWYGEDYAFSKRWLDTGNDLWICPDLDISHHSYDKEYAGNFHKHLIDYKGD